MVFSSDRLNACLDAPFILRSSQKVRRLARQPVRELRNNLAVRRDYRRFMETEAPRIAQLVPAQRTRGTVLIVSLSPIIYRVKLEIMFALAVARAGYQPVVLSTRETGEGFPYTYLEYFHGLPFIQLLLLEQQGPGPRDPNVRRVAGEMMEELVRTRDWEGVRYGELNLGRHVKSAIGRNNRIADIDLDDPGLRKLCRRLLPHFVARAIAAEKIYGRLEPKAAFFQDVIYLNYGSLFEEGLRRGVNLIQHMPCQWQDHSLMLRRFSRANRLEHPNALSKSSWQGFLSRPWDDRWAAESVRMIEEVYQCESVVTKRNQGGKRIMSEAEVRRMLDIPAGKFVVCIFAHILWDSNGAFGQDIYPDFGEWLADTLRVGMPNKEVIWIVKLHPDSLWKKRAEGWTHSVDEKEYLKEKLGGIDDNVRFMPPDTEINTFSLFPLIDCGITVKGSIAYQLPVFGIRAITTGHGKFCDYGFTDNCTSVGEYHNKIRNVHRLGRAAGEQTERAVRYVYAQFRLKPWEHTTFRMVSEHTDAPEHPLWWNLQMAPSAAEGEKCRDLKALTEWVFEETSDDYLNAARL